jgi:hypothetical protein
VVAGAVSLAGYAARCAREPRTRAELLDQLNAEFRASRVALFPELRSLTEVVARFRDLLLQLELHQAELHRMQDQTRELLAALPFAQKAYWQARGEEPREPAPEEEG